MGADLLGLSLGAEVTSAPILEARVVLSSRCLLILPLLGLLLGLLVDGLDFVLGGSCLRATHLLVVALVDRGELAGTLVPLTTHLLAHHLGEGTASLRHLEGALGLLGFCIVEFFLHHLDIRRFKGPYRIRLPLGEVEHFEGKWRVQ